MCPSPWEYNTIQNIEIDLWSREENTLKRFYSVQ